MSSFDITTYQKGMLWIWLAVSGNFISETLGCRTQKLLSNNMLAKQIVTFAILYFVTGFVNPNIHNPFEHFKLSFIIWIFFILFTKMHLSTTIISFCLVCVSYILNEYAVHYEKENKPESATQMKNYSKLVLKCNMILICIGFGAYLLYEYKDYKTKFNFVKFLFGSPSCKHN